MYCMEPDCRHRGTPLCRGNRLLLRADGVMHVHVPHHKTARSSGVLKFTFPPELAELVRLYYSRAYPVLRSGAHADAEDHPYLFMNADGGAFTESCLSGYFKRMMLEWDGPCMAPRTMRHVFVDALMSSPSASNPSLRGAARVMGTSVVQFARHYDLRVPDREAQEAVHAMRAFRESAIAQYAHEQQGVAAPAAAAVDGDDDDDEDVAVML